MVEGEVAREWEPVEGQPCQGQGFEWVEGEGGSSRWGGVEECRQKEDVGENQPPWIQETALG